MSRKQDTIEPLGTGSPDAVAHQVSVPKVYPATFNKIKSPLRYPGGKSRAVSTMLDIIPRMLDSVASPFFGGGSIELALVSKGVRVYGYDAFKPLVLFWQAIISDPVLLADNVSKYYPMPRDQFYDLQSRFRHQQVDDDDLPAVFYALNRSSYSGTTMSGGMSPNHERFTQSSIDRVRDFQSYNLLSVDHASFEDSLLKHKNDFLYCDPPYANGEALYGQRGDCHKGFDHEKLSKMLASREGWVLSYNDCSLVRNLYQGFTILDAEWTYGMNSDKKSNEVIILSRGF